MGLRGRRHATAAVPTACRHRRAGSVRARASSRAPRPPGLHPRLPLRPRRRPHPDGDRPLRGLEAHLRRVPPARTSPGRPEFSQLDYNRFVDGKPRADGVRDFLASRGITLPEGGAGRPADAATVQGDRHPQERARARASSRSTASRSTRARSLPAGGEGGRAGDRGGDRVGQRRAGHRRRPGSPTSSTSASTGWSPPATACAASRSRTPSWPAPALLGVEPAAGGRLRGRALRRRGGPGGRLRLRRRGRPGRARPTRWRRTGADVVVAGPRRSCWGSSHDRGARRPSRSSRGR